MFYYWYLAIFFILKYFVFFFLKNYLKFLFFIIICILLFFIYQILDQCKAVIVMCAILNHIAFYM